MKKIFIHVGPAKSGSSAIQNFCNSNPAVLGQLGVMYPSHTLMESGVSAGNMESIFDTSRKGKPKLSQAKILKLLSDFEKSNFSTLLLSSENFFGPMPELARIIPEAQFIFYLRNPLSLVESLYNQDVKTLRKTEPFEIKTRRPNFGTIGHLMDFVKLYGREKVIVRFYDHKFFNQGNIVNDLFEAMGLDYSSEVPRQQVNTSYTLEALETKRFLNNFIKDDYTDYLLNNLLQQYRKGVTKYSFLQPDEYHLRLDQVCEKLDQFFQIIPCDKSSDFITSIKETKQNHYYAQGISNEKLVEVRSHIFSINPPLYYHLCGNIRVRRTLRKGLASKAEVFTAIYSPSNVVRLFYRLKFQAEKAVFINQLRMKQLKRK